MALKTIVDAVDDLPADVQKEYTKDEASGKYVLTLEGVEAHPGVVKLNTALTKERDAHKATKGKLGTYAAFGDPEKVQAALDRIPELEAAAEGKLDETKINGIVEGRLKTKLAPIERERDQLKTQLGEKDKVIGEYTAAEVRRKVTGSVSKAARELKVVDSAVEDVELYAERLFEVTEDGSVVTKEGVGVTPGLSPKLWLEDMQAKRPHWFGTTAGGGARGGAGGGAAGENPWSAEHWNMTKQGQILSTKGRTEADRLAKLAGTTVGGPRPKAKAAA